MSEEKTYFPGYNEDIRMEEYEKIKNVINEKYGSDDTSLQIRSELEVVFNKLFDDMMEEFSDRVFDVLYVMMECFNITEAKAIRYLNNDNKEKVRNYAMNNFNTYYYEQLEKKKLRSKMEKKGEVLREFTNIMDLFE